MTIRKRFTGVLTAMAVFAAMSLQLVPVKAATPSIEEIKYEGNGVVEVEFYGDVEWNTPKVTVKDGSGKKYKTTIIKYDDDEIDFKIKRYKKNKKYKFKIKSVRQFGTTDYGTVKGSVKIPSDKGGVSRSKAKRIALNNAAKRYNIQKSTVNDYSIEKDYYNGKVIWEIDFDARKKSGGWFEYDYKISKSSGKILHSEEEAD